MRKTPPNGFILMLLMAALGLNACAAQPVLSAAVETSAEQETAGPHAAAPIVEPAASPTVAALPPGLPALTAENAADVALLAEIPPAFPPYELISPDGRMGARADLQGIDVYELDSGTLATHIDVALPDCPFGRDRYFSFNADGSFIAVAGMDAIQVWQVGGGLVYESPNAQEYNPDTCGADIPQLALSPDASLLAINGVTIARDSAQDYFRVIATLQNEVVYEWDGRPESLHGDLYTFRGLGFSQDGTALQTFDASRFYAFSGEEYQAFRFWSVNDWQALPPDAQVARNFTQEGRLYVLQGNEVLQLKSRLDGQVQASLAGTGCTQAHPCDARLSPQAETVALLNNSADTLAVHREVLATDLSIWDWDSETKLAHSQVVMRNLDGLLPGDDGSVLSTAGLAQPGDPVLDWWTSSFNFDGLYSSETGVTFRPQVLNVLADQDCYYCGTCNLDADSLQLGCQDSFLSEEGHEWRLERDADGSEALQAGTAADSAYDLPLPADAQEDWDVRLLGYSETYQTAFYCLDNQGRSQTCVIAAEDGQRILAEVEDIYGLRFSADGSRAAYIDRREKALFLLNLETGKLSKQNAYQSRAWFVNPAFTAAHEEMDAELVYVIQNLNDESILSLEWVDAAEGRVLRRATLDAAIGQPSALGLSAETGLVTVGTQDGAIFLLEGEKGTQVASLQAGTSAIIGLAFAEDDSLLVSLDEQGNLRLWGVD
ncbi:MAG: hypothetical protein PWQ55_2232 [Chloroflexota bacterium]|nr:hypothetical protein [Chloroflexota bacterium]